MVTVIALKEIFYDGKEYKEGDTLQMDRESAQAYIDFDLVRFPAGEKPAGSTSYKPDGPDKIKKEG